MAANRLPMRLSAALTAVLLLVSACTREPAVTAAVSPVTPSWLANVVPIDPPAAAGSRYPHLSAHGGTVIASWLEPLDDRAHALRYARLSDGWSSPATVASGRDWMVNWADFPSVVPLDHDVWVAHWLRQRPGGIYAYDVRISVSRDQGAHWSNEYSPHDDGTPSEHGFVTIEQQGGRPYAVWLDGRHTAGDGQEHQSDHESGGAMTLRAAALEEAGAAEGAELDDRVCDCCQTDAARTRDALLVVYRDRDEAEIRDIRALRLDARGGKSSLPVHADGWRIEGCPVNGPAIAARGDDVAVAWFTAPDRPRVRLAFSRDGGRSFDEPIEVVSGRTPGRVDVVLLEDGRAIVSWLDQTPTGGALFARPFRRDGPDGDAVMIASQAIERSSGFPQMILRGRDELVFAWTEASEPPRIRAVRARLR